MIHVSASDSFLEIDKAQLSEAFYRVAEWFTKEEEEKCLKTMRMVCRAWSICALPCLQKFDYDKKIRQTLAKRIEKQVTELRPDEVYTCWGVKNSCGYVPNDVIQWVAYGTLFFGALVAGCFVPAPTRSREELQMALAKSAYEILQESNETLIPLTLEGVSKGLGCFMNLLNISHYGNETGCGQPIQECWNDFFGEEPPEGLGNYFLQPLAIDRGLLTTLGYKDGGGLAILGFFMPVGAFALALACLYPRKRLIVRLHQEDFLYQNAAALRRVSQTLLLQVPGRFLEEYNAHVAVHQNRWKQQKRKAWTTLCLNALQILGQTTAFGLLLYGLIETYPLIIGQEAYELYREKCKFEEWFGCPDVTCAANPLGVGVMLENCTNALLSYEDLRYGAVPYTVTDLNDFIASRMFYLKIIAGFTSAVYLAREGVRIKGLATQALHYGLGKTLRNQARGVKNLIGRAISWLQPRPRGSTSEMEVLMKSDDRNV